MKRFLIKFFLVVFPLLLVFSALEIFFRLSPNAFSQKANHLQSNLASIEVLVLGSSHMQTALNPEFAHFKMANIAYGSQDYFLDSALLFNFLPKMKSLKAVILELDYHSLEYSVPENYWRKPWYNYYYDLNLHIDQYFNKISFLNANLKFFLKQIQIILKGNTPHLNEFGFSKTNSGKEFYKLKYDSLKIARSATSRIGKRHNNESKFHFNENVKTLQSMIGYCLQNNVKVILLSNPVYYTYKESFIAAKENRRRKIINKFKSLFPEVYVLDLSNLNALQGAQFYNNDDHLNPIGARIFTQEVSHHIKGYLDN